MKTKYTCISSQIACLVSLALGATVARAGNDTWDGGGGDNNWSTAANWAATSANTPPISGDSLFFSGVAQLTANNNLTLDTSFAGLTFNSNAGSFVLTGNEIVTSAALADNSPNLETINLPVVLGVASHSVSVVSGGSLLVGGVISDGGSGYGITLPGEGLVTLTNVNTYSGATTINAGQLTLDFTLGASSIVSSSSPLSMGGGTLQVNGNAAVASSQTFNGTTFSAGANIISVAPVSGSTVPTLALGGFTYDAGATVVFNGPSYANAATTTTGQPGAYGYGSGTAVTATANITTTSGIANEALWGGLTGVTDGSSLAVNAPFAAVGLYDFAIVVNTSPFTVIGASQGTTQTGTATGGGESNGTDGAYTLCVNGQLGGTGGGSGGPIDVVGTCAGRNTDEITALRFNSTGPGGYTGSGTCSFGGVLVTPNVGANNIVMSGGMVGGERSGSPGSLAVFQNNTSGFLYVSGAVGNNTKTAGTGYTQSGAGTVDFVAVNTYTGPSWLNGGVTEIIADSGFGVPSTAATVTLNSGTIVGNATFAMDNAGATPRSVILGLNGGGLAAASGDTMTVDGVVSNTLAGGGPLTIGIPASSANGSVAGLVAGSNMGTNTSVMATGTVALTGANTYTAGTIVLGGGTLNINGINALGGANYGGLALNGGTLQYKTSFSGNGSGDLTSIGAAGITLAAGADTIDANGNTVTFAGSIGNGGSGALTVASTALGGVLNLDGADTYTGNTTISGGTLNANNASGSATGSGNVTVVSGATLGGTGKISGSVTWQAGSFATLTVGSPLTVGSATLTNTAVTVVASGLTTGVYTLLTATGGISAGSTVNATPGGSGAIANGYAGTVSISGNNLILTVTALGVLATWTATSPGQNWSLGGDWTGSVAPRLPGDAGILGVSASGSPVDLNIPETLGGLTFTNASSYTVSGANTLTLDNAGHAAEVTVTAGTANAISTPVAINDPLAVTVNPGTAVTLGGIVTNETSSPESITVAGGGTAVLSVANGYGPAAGSVGTTVSGGSTLQVANNSALGAGDVSVISVSGGTLQAGASTLALNNNINIGTTATVNNNGDSLTLNGTISGGPLTTAGTGTVTLGGNNTYTGNTTINAGVLSVSSVANVADTPNLVLNGGDLLGTGTLALPNNIGIGAATATGFIDASGTLTLNGVIATAGSSANNLTVNTVGGSGMVVLGNANTFNGTTTIGAGTLQLANASALQNSTLNYTGGGALDFGTLSAATLGGLNGSKNLPLLNDSSGAVALTVGGNGATTVYTGALSDGGAGATLTFSGSGALTLAGNNSYTGTTTAGGGGTLAIATGGAINGGALAGSGFLVAGGTLTCSANTTLANLDNDFLETAGSVTAQAFNGPAASDGALIEIAGGYFSATSVSMGRTVGVSTGPSATAPIAAATTSGFYVDSTNTASPAVVDLGSISFGNANSSGSMLVDGNATVVVTNEVEVGAITAGSTRWSVLQINNGSFTSLDTVNGIVISQNGGGAADNAEVYLSGGTTTANIINFGLASDAAGGQGYLIVSNASLYMGSGGIVQPNTAGYLSTISLISGMLGATADWSSQLAMGLNGTSFTIQAADASGGAHAITLSGAVSGSGALVKTGNGTLTLNGGNNYSGLTTVSNGTLFISTAQAGYGDVVVNDGTTFGVINVLGSGLSAEIGNFTLGNNSGPTTLVFTNVASLTTTLLASSDTVTLNGNCAIKIADSVNLTAPNEYPLLQYSSTIVTNSGTGFSLSLPPGVQATLTNDASISSIALLVTGIAPPPVVLGSPVISGNDLVLSATGGTPGDPVTVLSTTNLALPLANWTTVTSGNYDPSGDFSYTVTGALSSGLPNQFYILKGQ